MVDAMVDANTNVVFYSRSFEIREQLLTIWLSFNLYSKEKIETNKRAKEKWTSKDLRNGN